MFQGNHTLLPVNGTPIVYEPTWKNQARPVPSKIARYVDNGFEPVVRSTTSPPMTKARSVVTSAVTSPPARWRPARRCAAP